MKRRYILTLVLMLLTLPCVMAQKHLNISAVFDDRYRKNPNATETLIKGEALRDYKLAIYRGITLTDMPQAADEIEPLVTKDGAKAIEREMSYKKGRLYYAFLQMPSLADDNVYLFYINQHQVGGNKIILIYMRGTANRAEIMTMLKN